MVGLLSTLSTPCWATSRIRIRRDFDETMRVPDYVLKCVGYVALFHSAEAQSESYDLEGTGFCISVPCKPTPGNSFFYFATAKHVVEHLDFKGTEFLVNKKGGGIGKLQAGSKWYFHPSEPSVDVAVMPFNIDPSFDLQ